MFDIYSIPDRRNSGDIPGIIRKNKPPGIYHMLRFTEYSNMKALKDVGTGQEHGDGAPWFVSNLNFKHQA
jgi:hypothetical protein